MPRNSGHRKRLADAKRLEVMPLLKPEKVGIHPNLQALRDRADNYKDMTEEEERELWQDFFDHVLWMARFDKFEDDCGTDILERGDE